MLHKQGFRYRLQSKTIPGHPDSDPDMLSDALGIEPDRENLRYYILLDELF